MLRHAVLGQRAGEVDVVDVVAADEQGAEHGQPDAGAEVPRGLGDPGYLAVLARGARLTVSVLADVSMNPIPAPASMIQIHSAPSDRCGSRTV
jgi:hypothetical protein